LNPIIEKQFLEIKEHYQSSTIKELLDGKFLITVPDVVIPEGWNKKQVTIWFIVPLGYPVAKPCHFWSDEDLRLIDGITVSNIPLNASFTQTPNEEVKLWFSWCPNTWNPNRHDLLTYLNIIKTRFRELK